jgi:predicted transcriptional regulator
VAFDTVAARVLKRPRIARRIGWYYGISVQTISLRLPDDLLVQLDEEAKARRMTKSRLIREGLEKVLGSKPRSRTVSCYDLARDLAGLAKGLPEDLADNPKYMEGFAVTKGPGLLATGPLVNS